MKKLLVLVTMIIIVLLAGCMADIEPAIEDSSIYDYLKYSASSMSYINTPESDILYLINDTYSDFVILNRTIMNSNLSSEEQLAYKQLFSIMDDLSTNTTFRYRELDTYSSSDFNTLSNSSQITLTLGDIVTFNALKTLLPDIKSTLENDSSAISKIYYIEYKLDRDLTNEEVISLDLLQEKYLELYYYDFQPFDFKQKTLEDLLFEFETKTSFDPT
ncbi:MAG: hypothetical protein KAJ22_02275, partial [Candidatus Izimaplasma sp.]|nr:hypothetical protein [Candidatus Izimaplasma bacterium]